MTHFLLEWNGTFLNNLDKKYIVSDRKEKTLRIMEIKDDSDTVYRVIVTDFKNSVPLIADELKPLFKLRKLGRHSCMIKGKKKILTRIEENHQIFNEIFCRTCVEDDIKKSFFFRFVVGLTYNVDKSLSFEGGNVTSFYENDINFEKSNLSKTCLNKWFDEGWDEITLMTKNLLKNSRDMNKKLMSLKFKIHEIVVLVDKEYTWICNQIIDRLNNLIE